MPQSRERKDWSTGRRLHIGAKVVSGALHGLVTAPANAYDLTSLPELQRSTEPTARGEASHLWGSTGGKHTLEEYDPPARPKRAK